jgi:hypothetical protein
MRNRRYGLWGGVIAGAAGLLIGLVIALTSSANAASTPSPSSYSTSTAGDADGHGGGGHAGESAPSSSVTSKLRAEALKAVPGGKVDRVETDSGDAAYEAHMTKSDGTQVTVKFDKSYKVTGVEDGMGK